MRTIRLGRTGAEVPAVSLGTWAYGGENKAGERSIGWSGHDDEDARAAMRAAFEAGITHWDTADVYGDGRSEALIGGMWAEVPRDAIFLASKVGWDKGGHERWYHPAMMRAHLDASLRRLETEVIDLYYLHHSDFGPEDAWLDDAIEHLHRAREQGKIRFIGLSDWSSERIMRVIERVDPDVVQPYRNVAHDTYAASGLRAWVEDHDVGVAFFSPLRQGLLLGKYESPTTFPDGDVRNNDPLFRDAAGLARLRAAAAALRDRFADAPEPVLGALTAAILADAPTGCALLGQRSAAQVSSAAAAGALVLTADAADWVKSLYQGL